MAAMDRDAILAAARLQTLVEDTNVSDAEIVLIINQCVDEVSIADYWPFLEASATATLVDSTRTVALPSDWEYMLAVVDDDNDRTIDYIAPTTLFFTYGNDTGNEGATPLFYTIWENLIYLTPIPSAGDTDRLTLYYYKTGTQLSAGATTPDWHEAFHPLVVEYVKWKIYEREEYYEQAERAFQTYLRYLSAMSTWYARRAKRMPGIAGDGMWTPKPGDPNIPSLRNL